MYLAGTGYATGCQQIYSDVSPWFVVLAAMSPEDSGRGGSAPEIIIQPTPPTTSFIVQELCESRGGRPGLSVLTSFLVSVDVKQY